MRKPRQINGTSLPAFSEAFKDFNLRAVGKTWKAAVIRSKAQFKVRIIKI